ncbi:MAG: transposase [candidate division Zixibacteria bacterium]|nr:transposase [candidate division Zixibacteria bacterium]
MSILKRYYNEGNIYFITCVTQNRERILIQHQSQLKDSIRKYKAELNFSIIAWVILPDHFHMIINPRDNNLSKLFNKIKLSFSKKFRYLSGVNKGRIWQSRFWDHVIRNQEDMNNHIDYIHYNPVKYGYMKSPFDWEHSSINEYFKRGYYSKDWGVMDEIKFDDDYGE